MCIILYDGSVTRFWNSANFHIPTLLLKYCSGIFHGKYIVVFIKVFRTAEDTNPVKNALWLYTDLVRCLPDVLNK
jgi:hypothetical protein